MESLKGFTKGTLKRWARRKTYGLAEADPMASHSGGPTQLAKVLNMFDLTLLGVGSTLGVGIYVLAGSVALDTAGPAVCISFLVAAIASTFAAMSYAEFGARVPKAGSAYVYSYVTVGEFIAFVIGWNLILEYLIGTASVARAFSANLDALTNYTMSNAFEEIFPIEAPGLSPYADFFCLGVTLLLTVLLGLGVRSSAIFTNVFTFVNITVVLFVIIGGAINADPNNWRIPQAQIPEGYGTGGFLPYGFAGVMAGAAKCFFAFVGFDSIAATGEEAKNPKRDIPLSINFTLVIVFFAYFGVSTVITLMWPYYLQDPNTPLVHAFEEIGWDIAAWTISIGSLFGLAASLLGAMIPLPRIIYAKAKDGLVFRFLAQVSPRFQTPMIATAVSGVMAAILGTIFDLDSLVDMMSIGTLLAYTLVAVSVLILRYDEAEQEGLSEQQDATNLSSWNRAPTRQTSKNAIYSTVLYCILTIVACGIIVNLETSDLNPWMLFGIGLSLGPMVMIGIYLALLPRSRMQLYFKVPAVPLIPCLSIVINTYLMFKLSPATWIRFGVWMAVGFLMYFGYGMWNSSQEYVDKGKIPPGGVEPLPQTYQNGKSHEKSKMEMVNEADNPTAELDEVLRLSAMAEANRRSRVLPITSLDDDDSISKAEDEKQNKAAQFTAAIDESHNIAKAVFEEAKHEREKAKLEAAMLQSHKHAEEVFAKLRNDRETQQQEVAKQMAAFQKHTEEVHQELQELFISVEPIETRPVELNQILSDYIEESKSSEREGPPPAALLPSTPPPTPFEAVLNELKIQHPKLDNVESVQIPPPPSLPTHDALEDTSQKMATAVAVSSLEIKNGEGNKKKTGMPFQVLDELKLAISRAKSPGESEVELTDQAFNLTPSQVQGMNADTHHSPENGSG